MKLNQKADKCTKNEDR